MDYPRCKTCKHWRHWSDVASEQPGRYCLNADKIMESYSREGRPVDALVYDYSEGGGFWTGPDFGCVHHEAASLEELALNAKPVHNPRE